jgi:cell division protein FtsB
MPANKSNGDWGRWLLAIGAALVLVWVAFFDSHSLIKRIRWHHEHEHLSAENERLRQQIETLQYKLQQPLSDDVVERIAREAYGMRRPNETVYPIEHE